MHYTVTTWSNNPARYSPVKVASYLFAIPILHQRVKNLMTNDLFGTPLVIDPVSLWDDIISESLNNSIEEKTQVFHLTILSDENTISITIAQEKAPLFTL